MKPIRLLVALAILAGLGGAIWYSEKHPPQPKTESKTEKIISVAEDQVRRIEITRPAVESTVLEKGDGGQWEITRPKAYKADETAANSMVSNLASLNADQVVAEKNADWKTYGLDPAKLTAQVSLKNGKNLKLSLGDDAPTSSGVYARLEGNPRLFTIPSYVKSSLDKPLLDLRDKHILPFDSEKLSRVALESKDGTKEKALEFGRSASSWQILKPQPLRADGFAVDDLVRSVRDANFESVLEEAEKASAKYSFSSPYATFEAVDASGVHKLVIGKDKENTYYAKTTAMPGVFKIASAVAEALNKKLDDFRNKKLFDFGWTDPEKLEVRDGDVQITIAKKGDKWLRADAGNKALPAEKVQALIEILRNLSAKAFPADEASAQAKYGLNKPVAEARVTSDNGKRVEDVLLAEAPGTKYYAARKNEPATYAIDNSAYEDFRKAVFALK